ncbi:MAG: 30S ribosome-binding factor RbfA [Gammaproteobacteria bacterium]
MPRDFPRARRIEEQVRRELSGLLRHSLKDPRASQVTLTDVKVSKDLSLARVYVTSLDVEISHEEIVKVLNGAAGFLRHGLGALIRIRSIPNLQFHYDESIEYGARMDKLIKSAIGADKKQNSESD